MANHRTQFVKHQLQPWLDVTEYLEEMELVSLNPGPSGDLLLLFVTQPADYRERHPAGATFAKITTPKHHDFLVVWANGIRTDRFRLPQQTWNYHHVQPLPDEELLFVCARSRYQGPGDYDLNGKVFDWNGQLKREFLLGDGIQDVQVTGKGNIWTSFYDEGIFGNFGWHMPVVEPVGASGLVQWDRFGHKLYEFWPPAELDSMVDCYALNVTSNTEAWCYYYTNFPLVCIRNKQVYAFWDRLSDEVESWLIRGSGTFAIWKTYALFRGGYGHSNKYQLVELVDNRTIKLLATYQFCDEEDALLTDTVTVARGKWLYLLTGWRCYRVDLAALIRDLV